MAGFQTGLTLDISREPVDVVDSGTGPAVLLLHDNPGTSSDWQAQVPPLVAAGFRVVAPDLPPGAESAHAVRLLRAILRTLGIPRVHVVGQGAGARLGWVFAGAQAQRVDRLVVIGAGYPEAEDLCRLEIPVLAVSGETDTRVNQAGVLAARDHVGRTWRQVVIAGAGENVAVDQPARLNEVLREFLAAGKRAPRPADDIRAAVSRRLGGALTKRLRPGV